LFHKEKEITPSFSLEISPRVMKTKDSIEKEVSKEYFNTKPKKLWKNNGNDKML
tara:strand:+ start:399 stop:560 length:162 start_codon:yes stop_codon:yes gene_type:complete